MNRILGLLAIVASLSLSSCSSIPRGKTNYVAPSVAPTRQSIQRGQENIAVARTHVTTAQTQTKTLQAKIVRLEKLVANPPKGTAVSPELHDLVIDSLKQFDPLLKELTDTQTALAESQKNLAEAQAKAATLQPLINQITNNLNTANTNLNKALDDKAAMAKKYHALKLGVCLLAAGLVGFVIFHFGWVFGPFVIYGILGGSALTFAFLWWRL